MDELTVLLQRASAGDADARDPLYRLLYPELLRMARAQLARAGTLSLDPTALLHDAYVRLARTPSAPTANRRVFFAYAARVMHTVVIDYVRERGAEKRGGQVEHVTLSGVSESLFPERSVIEIEVAMEALRRVDERAFRVVEMRYFAGMTEEDIANALGTSVATTRRDWRKARAFLYEHLCRE
jgi:RNA polymerase sigma factor (TIGR02999 family)